MKGTSDATTPTQHQHYTLDVTTPTQHQHYTLDVTTPTQHQPYTVVVERINFRGGGMMRIAIECILILIQYCLRGSINFPWLICCLLYDVMADMCEYVTHQMSPHPLPTLHIRCHHTHRLRYTSDITTPPPTLHIGCHHTHHLHMLYIRCQHTHRLRYTSDVNTLDIMDVSTHLSMHN